jgi:hypothetical protein
MTMDSNQGGNWTGFSFWKAARTREDQTAYEIGGACFLGTAAATVLNSGDVVFQSATGFDKSATQANYVGLKCVVVGGKLTDNDVVYGTGKPCTTGVAGESVLLQCSGWAWVVAGGTVTPGTHFTVIPDTGTAGRVIAGTTAGQVIGATGNVAGAAAGDMKIFLSPR